MISHQSVRHVASKVLSLFLGGVFALSVLSGCGQTRHEEALQTARTLMSTGGLSDTRAIRYLETSNELLKRLASVKIRASQNRLYVLEKMMEKYENLKMWPKAAKTVDKLTKLQPTEIRWRLAKGRIHSRWSQVDDGHVKMAREAFNTALELNPDSLDAKYGLGILLAFRSDNRQAGRSYLEQVANHTPVNSKNRDIVTQARFALGRLDYETMNYGDAAREFRRIINMGNISSSAQFTARRNLGRTYLKMGDRDRAREQLQRAYEIRPYDREIRRMLRDLGVELSDRYSRFD